MSLSVPPPTASSLAHRAEIARLISPLRRVRPKVPFYDLAAHRIPTLWTLYRSLLRHAERENVKWRIAALFRQNRHTIQAHVAREQLMRGHKWLDMFVRAKQGDARLGAVLDRYDRMIAAKRDKAEFPRLVREALQEQARLRRRPIFKGSFIRPTYYNKLLPRLVPQPASISGMIHKRRTGRDKRFAQKEEVAGWMEDLKMESAFEQALLAERGGSRNRNKNGGDGERVFSGDLDAWLKPLLQKQHIINTAIKNDYARLYSPYPPALLAAGTQARRLKIHRNTLQGARERRGEIFSSTLKRMRQRPPAHIFEKMTPEQKKIDAIIRGPGEAGYTAAVKRRMGVRLKNPESWILEDGRREDWERLDRMEGEVRVENKRRRQVASVGQAEQV
ncbi:hypothetical protein BDN67DRAFT_952994 [Paxillus ammoniavirescens]|nr:hypothetical protein BDN67DRAFT_952994 [Paxillus ammoniavirescens]